MYKEALKCGYRYESVRGLITTEDLFHVPLRNNNGFNLDEIAKNLSKKIKEESEESFVVPKTDKTSTLNKKLEIVKDVIKDKLDEEKARLEAAEKAEKKRKILELLAKKQEEKLGEKTEEELLKELEKLG